MYTVLFLQNGECHISSYRQSNGNYRTICCKTVSKASRVTTLGTDDTFSGPCAICKGHADAMYHAELNDSPQHARNRSTNNLANKLEYARANLVGPEVDYMDVEDRYWHRLTKYQRLLPKAKPSGKKPKKYKPFKFK